MTTALFCAIAYFLGSVNFSIIVSRYLLKKDIRERGSGNAGATNSIRVMGKKIGIAVSLWDVLKGVISVLLARSFADEKTAWLAALFCVVGHMYPVFFGFRGGKGVLTGVSVVLMLDYRIGLACLGIFILAVLLTRLVSLGSVLASAAAPFLTFFLHRTAYDTAVIAVIVALIIYKHRGNIERMVKKTEPRVGDKKKKENQG